MSKKEGRYYVEYLGWKEVHGLFGREFTEPIVRELLARHRHSNSLPKMTIKVNENELQISQEVSKKGSSKPEKTKYPAIPTQDATFAVQGLYPDTDVVACIFLGYNPYTKCAVHTHVYRFDSENTAAMFVRHLTSIIDRPEYKLRVSGIEKDLSDLGHVTLRRSERMDNGKGLVNGAGSDGVSYGTPSPLSSESLSPKYPTAEEALKQRADIHIVKSPKPEPDKKTKRIFNNLQEELEYKLNLEDGAILLPPKDYDTIVRRHGHLSIRDQVKSKERSIVGPNAIFGRVNAEPYMGTVEEVDARSSQSTSDSADVVNSEQAQRLNSDKHYLKPGNEMKNEIYRSQSDTQANMPSHSLQLRRQHSQASSDHGSAVSDEFYADGLYQGYKPLARLRSKDSPTQEDMAMWSPSYSFGPKPTNSSLSPHMEEEPLSHTAPSGFLPRKEMRKSYHSQDKHRIRRSHSHRQNGEIHRHSYQ